MVTCSSTISEYGSSSGQIAAHPSSSMVAQGPGTHTGSEQVIADAAPSNGHPAPVTSSAGALVRTLHDMGARKVAMITPYMKPLTRMVMEYIEGSGITVLDARESLVPEAAACTWVLCSSQSGHSRPAATTASFSAVTVPNVPPSSWSLGSLCTAACQHCCQEHCRADYRERLRPYGLPMVPPNLAARVAAGPFRPGPDGTVSDWLS